MSTNLIVDTMLNTSENQRYSTRRTHRRYSPEFKATLLATCLTRGVSVAAVAGEHGMNSNVLHRWLKEHRALALVQPPVSISPATDIAQTGGFVPLQLPAPTPTPTQTPTPTPTPTAPIEHKEIRVELRKGSLSMVIAWPTSAVDDFLRWTAQALK